MATGKNLIPTPTKTYLQPTTDIARKFKESKQIGNKAQVYIALSPTLGMANESMKRAGITRMARNCILLQYADCVNTPSMDTDAFTFWTNEPASEQIILVPDIDYPTEKIISVLGELTSD
ncbi:hypothetical protein [Vibrio vulnificus]|uniref:hypothetical protein n=1 Tax=Vibrio vulnificus TaxID=672 RepID=UPI001594E067|nr:hypothetical protein [Vibrio vulnificus]NVC72626.1 hypothetical protein [Vibrio vulnificus]